MRTRDLIGLTIAAVIPCGGESRGQTPTVSVETEYLATVEAPLEPAQSAGSRVIVNVPAGGTVRGPKINGTLIAPLATGSLSYPMDRCDWMFEPPLRPMMARLSWSPTVVPSPPARKSMTA